MLDSHTHLNDPRLLPEIDPLLARMQEAGVLGALVVGYDVTSSRQAVELARRYPDLLRAAVGMHPHDSKHLDAEALAALSHLAREPEVVAYGEIGLDFHYDHSPRDVQQDAFRRQLRLAAELELPVIIHERDAGEEVMAILDAEGGHRAVADAPKPLWRRSAGGVWHCGSATPAAAKEIARYFFIGIAGWITFPKAENIRALARSVPIERLLIETDCPYLTPVPYRGKSNEPANLRLVAEALSAVKEIPLEDVQRITRENTFRAFPRWPRPIAQ
jgi:TatD DNase family protein